eukprot:TRINITY_DN1664_c0_g1_i1.p1 TRINITY_DN1664_c0_g1~~TRINITY_DN1664_c0_g1_i1.p1  ORF type:complete len:190 (+),score=67.96 TRINITY_DN1664_c0_g1_i1:57-626(+)
MSKRPRDDQMAKQLHQAVEGLQKKLPELKEVMKFISRVDEQSAEVMQTVGKAEKERESKLRKIEKDTRDKEMQAVRASCEKFHKVVVSSADLYQCNMDKTARTNEENQKRDKKLAATREKLATTITIKAHDNDSTFAALHAETKSLNCQKETLLLAIQGLRADIEAQKALTSNISRCRGTPLPTMPAYL